MGGITFNQYAGVQSDGTTGWLLGPVWDTVIGDSNSQLADGIGACIVPLYLNGAATNGLMGIEAANENLVLEAANSGSVGKVTGRLDNSSTTPGGNTGTSGATCWDNAPGTVTNPPTETTYYQNGGAGTNFNDISYATPSTRHYALLGNAGSSSNPLYTSEPDLYQTIQPHETQGWYDDLWQAFLRAGGRTGALSVLPNGPEGTVNSFAPPPARTISPVGLQMAYSGSCPSNAEPNEWPGWPAVYAVNHGNCSTSTGWRPGCSPCGVVYLIFDMHCTVGIPRAAGSCNPNLGPTTPNPIDGAPTNPNDCPNGPNNCNIVRLGYASIADSNDAFYAMLAYATGSTMSQAVASYIPTTAFMGSISGGTLTISSGSVGVGQTLFDTGTVPCGSYTTSTNIPCGTFITGYNANNGTWTINNTSVSVTNDSITATIPWYSNGDFVTALSSPPFSLFTYTYAGQTYDVPGTSVQTPEEFLIFPSNRATGAPSFITTNLVEIDEERGDNCSQTCLLNEYTQINTILHAAGFRFNFRCDELGPATSNAYYSGCFGFDQTGAPYSSSISQISMLSGFSHYLIYETAGNQFNNPVTSFFTQAQIANDGQSPNKCTSFYTMIGIRVLLSNLSPSDWGNLNSQVITGACVYLIEDVPNGQQLGGSECYNNNFVLNPLKWANGGGFATYQC